MSFLLGYRGSRIDPEAEFIIGLTLEFFIFGASKSNSMKIATFFFVLLFIAQMGFSQELKPSQVPNPVRQAFTKQFPAARGVRYASDSQNYSISFLETGKECVATYNSDGKLLETDKEIAPSSLPKLVSSAINKNFAGYTIMTSVKREALDAGVCYETDLKKGDAGYSVRFSEKGEILQKKARTVQFKVTTKGK